MKRLLALIIAAVMIFALVPAAAGAAPQAVVISLTVGSPTVTINGAPSAVQKPFQASGTTMVPLSVITKAFGAGLNLNKKVITLSYNNTKVILTIGSKKVSINGKEVAIAVEPKIVNSTTMVPLRVIAQAFGATISVNGKQITIVGFKAGGSDEGSEAGAINPDAGKTKVGDSYYGWSMNYPADLILSYQSDNGSWTEWSDTSGQLGLFVSVEDVDQQYSREELRDFVTGLFNDNEFAVEKKTIDVGGLSFEKIVSRDRDGWFFEYRAAQRGNRIYVVAAAAKSDSRDGLNKYQDLLNSFQMTFDKSAAAYKDITKVVDGYIPVVDKEYGLKVDLPVDWRRDKDAPRPTFYSDKGFMQLYISSLKDGDTAESWLDRTRADLEKEFASDYIRNFSESTIQLKNGTAQVLSYEYSWTKDKWYTEHDVFFVSGSHKYQAAFFYLSSEGSEGESLFNRIAGSMEIDTAYVDKTFADIADASELEGLTVKKTSRKYGYAIELPQTWTGVQKDFEDDFISYTVPYGGFSLGIVEDRSASQVTESLRSYFTTDEDMKKDEARVLGQTQTTVAGVPATILEADVPKAEQPYVLLAYIFEKNGITYSLMFSLNKANDTDSNRSKLEQVVQSFVFTN